MKKLVRKTHIDEDAPANNIGGGNIEGAGVGTKGEAGVLAKWQKKYQQNNQNDEQGREVGIALLRRKTPLQENHEVARGKFAGHDTFIVPSDIFNNARMEKKKGKHWTKYIGEGPHADAIRQHSRKHYGKPIILQDERTGAMCYASYGNRKQTMKEAVLMPSIKKGLKFSAYTGRKTDDDDRGDKIAKIDDEHDLHFKRFPKEREDHYQVIHRESGKQVMTITGRRNAKTGTFKVGTLDSNGAGPRAHKVYRKLLQSGHSTSLVGDVQSPGGQKVWQRLSSERGVSVHGWHKGKPVNLNPKDSDETHVVDKEKYRDGEGAIANMKLVASYHPTGKTA